MSKESHAWVRLDVSSSNPGIRGSSQGLKHLRDKIKEAIEEDYSMMEAFDCDFNCVELSDNYPEEKKEGLGFRILMVILAVILILGVFSLVIILVALFGSLVKG